MAAVIGDPVRHSLSPAIHNAAFAATGLDWVYVAFPVPAGRGGEAVAAMSTLGIDGLSVTMPHKAAVAAAADRRAGPAEALGVANCVYRDGSALVATSTDGDGFVRALGSDGISTAGARVVVIGTGGAARALIEALGRSEPDEIVVISRRRERAVEAAALAPMARAGDPADVAAMDLVINASPVGMAGGPDPAGSPVAADSLGEGQIVVDIVYEPRETPLLAEAQARGARTVNGVGMLVHQAALAFELWTGEPAPLGVMEAAALG